MLKARNPVQSTPTGKVRIPSETGMPASLISGKLPTVLGQDPIEIRGRPTRDEDSFLAWTLGASQFLAALPAFHSADILVGLWRTFGSKAEEKLGAAYKQQICGWIEWSIRPNSCWLIAP